jgi:tetratricopeptide (TPR) repeat protein
MMSDDPKDQFEGTMVDLGEDLLESTRASDKTQEITRPISQPPPGAPPPPAAESTEPSIAEEMQKGEIFMSERIFEDAKQVFRRVLRRDPNNAAAKQYLDEIQKHEIQELLKGEPPRKRIIAGDTPEEETPSSVLEKLEKELNLNIEKSELKPIPDLFDSEAAFARYKDRVLDAALAVSVRDRIDIGVAHLEMGLFDVSQAIFESVMRYDEYKIVGMYLLGLSLIHGGKAIEATIRLEPLARDLTLTEAQKTDFLYLMGLAFERLNDLRKAREFFRRVHMLNPRYRDVFEKLK